MGSIALTRLEELTYLFIRREAGIASAEEQAGDDPLLSEVHRDIWAAAFLEEPQLAAEVPRHLAAERQLLERLLANPAWEEVRAETVGDEWLSAALAVPTARKLLELLSGKPDGPSRRGRSRAAGAGQEAQSATPPDAAGEELDSALARAALEAADEARAAREATGVCLAWGVQPGRPRSGVPGKEVVAVAEKLAASSRLREIVRLAGRFTRIALQKRRSRVKREPTEVAEIEMGGELARLLPSELVALADPLRRPDFYRRFIERKMLQYRLDVPTPQGRGPLVVCVDESGSMAGEREVWAKAVALACFNIAAKESRPYALVHFGSAHEIRVDRFPRPRRVGPAQLLEAVEHFFGGGTDFEAPLAQALEVMEESPFRRGDVVFITDALCRASEAFAEEF
ncbi:MAG: VWA domain-containing protein, partial [Bacillota bacterium]